MKKILGMLFLVVLASPVLAAGAKDVAPTETVKETAPTPPALLDKLRGTKKDLNYDYVGERFGVQAWLLSGPNVMQVIYVVPGQKAAMIGGAVIGPEAEDLGAGLLRDFMKEHPQRSQEIMTTVRSGVAQKQAEEAAKSPSEKLWQDLAGVGQVTFGTNTDAPVVYAVLDPVQPETKGVWGYLSPLAKDNSLTLHVVPLALTTGDSIMTIASILGNTDPAKAWEEMLEGREITGDQAADAKGALGIKATVDLAQRLNLHQTPFLVYRLPAEGGKWGPVRILRGMPKDWDKFLSELGALPARDNKDNKK